MDELFSLIYYCIFSTSTKGRFNPPDTVGWIVLVKLLLIRLLGYALVLSSFGSNG